MTHPDLRPWETLESRDVYSSHWMTVSLLEVRLPNGRIINDFHRITLRAYAVIFAQTDDGSVVVERQYKHGVGAVGLTLPAGLLEDDEDPMATAQRELLEETGYAGGHWRSLGSFVPNANYGAGRAHLFAAAGVAKVAEPASGDLEEMEILLQSPDELAAAVRDGQVASLSATTAITLALDPRFAGLDRGAE